MMKSLQKSNLKLKEIGIPLIGEVPYDKAFTESQINKQSIIEYANDDTSEVIHEMWSELKRNLK